MAALLPYGSLWLLWLLMAPLAPYGSFEGRPGEPTRAVRSSRGVLPMSSASLTDVGRDIVTLLAIN